MKTQALLTFFILLFAINSKAEEVGESRDLQPFREVSLRLSANLFIEQGDGYRIEMSGRQETLDRMIVEVVDHKLIIRFSYEDMLLGNFDAGKITLKVTTPTIEMLSIAGSGNIIAEKPVQSRVLELFIAGSGDIKIANLSCERVETEITGSGDVVLLGQPVKEVRVLIAGSGNFIGSQLKTEFAKVRIAGSGNCDIYADNFIDARIVGSGDIRYKGEALVESGISGSGKIQKIN